MNTGFRLRDLLISVRADARVLIVEGAVDVRAVVEGAVPPLDGSPPSLVHEVPVEAGEGAMLVALVLKECLTLLHTKLLQVPLGGREGGRGRVGVRDENERRPLAGLVPEPPWPKSKWEDGDEVTQQPLLVLSS